MAQSKFSVEVDKKFAWSKHTDAYSEYAYFQMQHTTRLLAGKYPRTYIQDEALVTLKRGVMPDALVTPTEDELWYYTTDELNVWKYKKENYDKAVQLAKEANDHIDAHFASGIADIEVLFAINCNARTSIMQAKYVANVLLPTHEAQYRAIITRLELDFKPSANLDSFNASRSFETLTDTGTTYTDYYAEYTRLHALCSSLACTPSDNLCETVIIEHFHNPNFAEQRKKLILDRAECDLTTTARTYDWKAFLKQCSTLCAGFPDWDTWGLTMKESTAPPVIGSVARYVAVSKGPKPGKPATSSGGARSTSDACWRCGLSGHKFWKCPSVVCSKCKGQIGSAPAGMRIESLDHDMRMCNAKGGSNSTAVTTKIFSPQTANKKALVAMAKQIEGRLKAKREENGEPEPVIKAKKAKLRRVLRVGNGAPPALGAHPAVEEDDEEEVE
jgi:hypothetical protein